MKPIETIMRTAPVIPVIVIDDVLHARPVAEALVNGGLKVLEVTMRTPAALDAIAEMKRVDGAIVGAGTVLDPQMLRQAIDAGSEFIVAPGLTEALGKAANHAQIPFLPGVANASDIMRGLDLGLNHFKFFPAEANGGLPALKSLIGPFGQCQFCPTGGIRADTAADWLAVPEILCVGGSWLVPKGAPDTKAIEDMARSASALAA